jgi:hypothetical protein
LCAEVLIKHVWPDNKRGLQSASDFVDRKHRHEDRLTSTAAVEQTFMSFFDWVSLAWYHVVGTGNVDHFLAGCRVERIRSWGGVLAYCAKYMSKADAEGFMADVSTGRSWGIFNRGLMPWAKMVELPLDEDVGVRIRRIARRYLERRLGHRVKRHFGITVYCDVPQWKRLFEKPPDPPF